VTVEKFRRRNSRRVPRATKSAVSDWRPSGSARDLSDGMGIIDRDSNASDDRRENLREPCAVKREDYRGFF
jgi:hypothetical protein